MSDLILAIDAGTSAVKAAVFDLGGQMLTSASRPLAVTHPFPDQTVQSVKATFEAVVAVAGSAARDVGDRIDSVVVSSQRATFVPIDRSNSPLSEWISWQDHRGVRQCEKLRNQVGDDEYFRTTGLAIEPTAAISKIMWLADHDPGLFDSVGQFASHQGLILSLLGADEVVSSYSDAAYLGLFDITSGDWNPRLCELAGISIGAMGRVVPSGSIVGTVSSSISERIGISRTASLVVGGGDLQCGALGLGAADPSVMTVGLGTGGHCVAWTNEPVFLEDRVVSCQPHVLPDAWELEGIALSTASTWSWAARMFGDSAANAKTPDWDREIGRMASVPAGSDGVIVIPSLNGAGSPDWDPQVAGSAVGLRLRHGREHLLRASAEGICFELRRIKETMDLAVAPVTDVRLWGGPARSAFWAHLVADVFGVPVRPERDSRTGMLGAAVLAAVAGGGFSTHAEAIDSMVKNADPVEPDRGSSVVYEETYSRYCDAAQTLRMGFYRESNG